MNIAIFTRGLSNVMGGMERQLLSIASGYVNRGHDVTVISLDMENGKPFFDADPRIRFIGLSIGDSTTKATVKQRYLRQKKVFKLLGEINADLAIAFMTGSYWFAVLPAKLRRIKIVLAERNGPSIYTRTSVRRWRFLIFATMTLANTITVQFESYKKSYPFFLHRRIVAIPNKIPVFSKMARASRADFTFLFAGRLSNQKQINQLALAFVIFHERQPNTKLEIFGEGEQHGTLTRIIQEHKAEGYIYLNPPTKDISFALSKADAMIAPSLWEGFPNSVAEALASGIPVGGFDDCEGIRDLITDGKNGWLIERTDPVESQINLLQKAYASRFELEAYSESARKSVTKYQGEAPNEAWNQLATRLRFK